MSRIVVVSVVLVAVSNIETAKILAVLPIPNVSHQYMFRTLLQELSDKGHEITIVSAHPVLLKGNVTEIKFPNLSLKVWQNYTNIISDYNMDIVTKMSLAVHGVNDIFEQQLKSIEMRNLVNKKHSYFDLLLLEAGVVPVLSLSHIFKAPVILVSSVGAVLDNNEAVGAPTHPLLFPPNFHRRVYDLTMWEKVKQIYTHLRWKLVFRSIEKQMNLMIKSYFGLDIPSLDELKNNIDMLFLNINQAWANNIPVPPNVVYIGGIKPEKMEVLSQEFLSILNKSKYGVVYVNFGNIKPSRLPPKIIRIVLKVLFQLRYDVFLKWDIDRIPGAPKKIKLFQSLPQRTLLQHPKIKLFITSGDLESTHDAIEAGVPLVGIPIFGDQWYNTEKYVHFHIGEQVDIASMSEEKFINAIHAVINEESYRQSIADLRALMYDQPQSPLERAVWWTEYVLRHGGAKNLRAPAANLSCIDYYELRLVITLIITLFTILVLLKVIMTKSFRYAAKKLRATKKKRS